MVTRRNVNPGNNVQVGQSLMAVRSLTEIWIDGNFKETQLADLRIGQRVRCEVDMYGSRREFEGRITGFTMGTGQTLALLPPQNATGNFVKIVQRLPVRVELTDYDPDKAALVRRPVGHALRVLQGTAHGAARRETSCNRWRRCRNGTHESEAAERPHERHEQRGPRRPPRVSRPAINPWIVAAAVVVPTFMEVLDTTIANVALRYIAGGLSAAVIDSEWVITSYLAANAIILPISGWLSAHLGRRNYFLLSIAVFTIASGLCGMATSLGQIILFRVIQGLAGGGLQPSSQGVLLDSFPPEKQGAAQTMFGIAALLAPDRRPDAGRLARGQLQLALDLLHQPPGRRRWRWSPATSWSMIRITSSRSGPSCAASRSTSTTSAWGCWRWSCPAGKSCSARGRSGTGWATRSGGCRR